jgi:hypothetical protein
MPGDAKACRDYAVRCAEIAAETKEPRLAKQFRELATSWLWRWRSNAPRHSGMKAARALSRSLPERKRCGLAVAVQRCCEATAILTLRRPSLL